MCVCVYRPVFAFKFGEQGRYCQYLCVCPCVGYPVGAHVSICVGYVQSVLVSLQQHVLTSFPTITPKHLPKPISFAFFYYVFLCTSPRLHICAVSLVITSLYNVLAQSALHMQRTHRKNSSGIANQKQMVSGQQAALAGQQIMPVILPFLPSPTPKIPASIAVVNAHCLHGTSPSLADCVGALPSPPHWAGE